MLIVFNLDFASSVSAIIHECVKEKYRNLERKIFFIWRWRWWYIYAKRVPRERIKLGMRNESLRVECHYQWLYGVYISNIKFYLAHISLYQFYYRKGNFSLLFLPPQIFIHCEYVMKMLLWVIIFVSFYARRASAKKMLFHFLKLHSLVNLLLDFTSYSSASHKVKEIFTVTNLLCERFVESLSGEISAFPRVNCEANKFHSI